MLSLIHICGHSGTKQKGDRGIYPKPIAIGNVGKDAVEKRKTALLAEPVDLSPHPDDASIPVLVEFKFSDLVRLKP